MKLNFFKFFYTLLLEWASGGKYEKIVSVLVLLSVLLFYTGCIIHIKETSKKDKPGASVTHVIVNEKGKKIIIHEKD